MDDRSFTQNRELSWLRFNDRVLSEAMDETVPLLERLKFIAIFTSNLDEFFMIRVGSLFDLTHLKSNAVDSKSGMSAKQQLDAIYEAVRPQYAKRQEIYFALQKQLRLHGIAALQLQELTPADWKVVRQYFKNSVAPILSPQIVDPHHPFPHLINNVLHVGAWLQYKSRVVFAVIPMPAALPEVLFLPGGELRYVRTAEIVMENLEQIFTNYTVLERVIFCVTRNADINPNDEAFDFDSDDFRKKMQKALKQRKRLEPVRLELSAPISETFSAYLQEHLPVTKQQIFVTSMPLKLGHVFTLEGRLSAEKRSALTYPPFTPVTPGWAGATGSVQQQILRQDRLLSYPYESMAPFLRLVREAASDPAVLSIKITIYRLAQKAQLVEYLCEAAENGKDVTVLIELRARFDEQNNIDWSERLEEAGCTVIYGIEDYKVHSKVCLITRRERGVIQYITQIGTGNYNEKTARQYTDVCLMTADRRIGSDANAFFKNMAIGNLDGHYASLWVAPRDLKHQILQAIDGEIAKGNQGRVLLKLNSVTDIDVIEKLKQASCAGVQITMIVRGICCILPGVPGRTEQIRVISIVGRFLEHSRIYCFGTGSAEKMYISSADFMTRNMERRVEVACPIYQPEIREKLHEILNACLQDNVKARLLQADGSYVPLPDQTDRVEEQQTLMQLAEREAQRHEPEPPHSSFWSRLRTRLHRA